MEMSRLKIVSFVVHLRSTFESARAYRHICSSTLEHKKSIEDGDIHCRVKVLILMVRSTFLFTTIFFWMYVIFLMDAGDKILRSCSFHSLCTGGPGKSPRRFHWILTCYCHLHSDFDGASFLDGIPLKPA
jgi:hypothetical protein